MKICEIFDEDLTEVKKKKKKKKTKSNTYAYDLGGQAAEDHTKYDPPNTNYGKNISARAGFVGG